MSKYDFPTQFEYRKTKSEKRKAENEKRNSNQLHPAIERKFKNYTTINIIQGKILPKNVT